MGLRSSLPISRDSLKSGSHKAEFDCTILFLYYRLLTGYQARTETPKPLRNYALCAITNKHPPSTHYARHKI